MFCILLDIHQRPVYLWLVYHDACTFIYEYASAISMGATMKKVPLYQFVYDRIMNDVRSGVLQNGDKLPTEDQLAQTYEVSKITIKRALAMMVEKKYLTRTQGVGSFITVPTQDGDRRALSGNGYFSVGFVTTRVNDAFGSKLIMGASAAALARRCCLSLGMPYFSQREETEIINHLIACGVRGLIVMPIHGVNYNVDLLLHAFDGFPIVLADRNLPGLSVPYIGTDNELGAHKAMMHLFGLGHRRICFLSSMATTTAIQERYAGYVRAYAEMGIPLDMSLVKMDITKTMPEFSGKASRDNDQFRDYFGKLEDCTAILCSDDNLAAIALHSLDALGKRIPEDVSLISFDAFEHLDSLPSRITHIRQQEYDMGVQAFELLYRTIEGQPVPKVTLLEAELVIRNSTAACRGAR